MILELSDLLLLAFVILGILFWKFKPKKKSQPTSLTNERIVQLIKGEAKPKVQYTGRSMRVDPEEVHYATLSERYKIGKMFERASMNVHNKLELSDGSTIAPHNREHGFDAGRSVETLRSNILRQYGVDIAKVNKT